MPDRSEAGQAELARVTRRLERERRARAEAEAIGERALRELYEKQQALTAEIAQRKRLEEQVLHAQKMEAIGRLAGGVAHDFNNILTVIFGHAQMLSEQLPETDDAQHEVRQIHRAAERAAALTRQLLAFSRRQMLAPIVFDLNAVVTDLEQMLRRLISEDIRLMVELDAAVRPVKADPAQVEQIIINLVVNARDAMPTGGRLTIATGRVKLDERAARLRPEIRPGHYSMLAVSDTGHGMDDVVKARIFEPFFTTKGRGKGTGLGLATTYGTVKQSGGYIYVDTEPGYGARFEVFLPETQEKLPRVPVRPTQPRPSLLGTETILLVEDEEELLWLARRALQSKGHAVLAARNAEEAAARCRDHQGPIHLMVTDVIMPGINGRELSDRLALVRPGLRVLFVSGHAEETIMHHGVLDPGNAFLAKPYTLGTLLRKVRDVLDE